jgi:hypothetical protein
MGKNPILDEIEFSLERGLITIITLVITIITLVMIVKVVLTVIKIAKTTKTQEEEKKEITITSSSSFKKHFLYNLIEEDVASLDIQLSDEAKKLISTYRD